MPEPAKTKIRRPRRSRAEWAQIIERFNAGNDSVADFCWSEEISVGSFHHWRRKLRTISPPATRFIELDGPPIESPAWWQVELDLGDGAVLRLRRG